MPLLPLIIGGTIAAGSAIANYVSQRKTAKQNQQMQIWQNQQNAKLEQQRYDQQRRDALADFEMQNRWNSPQNQMNLSRQAGLNPNLIYGSGANTTAATVRSSNFDKTSQLAPQLQNVSGLDQIGQSIFAGIDLQQKQAQTDNLKQQNALMQQEALFKQAGTARTMQETARGEFDLSQAKELKDSVIQNAKLQNEKLQADTAYTLDQNQRSAITNASDLKLAAEKIITEKIAHARDNETIQLLKAQRDSLRQTQDINRYEQQLTEMGIGKSDPWYFRGLMNLIHGNMSNPAPSISEMYNSSSDYLKRLFNQNGSSGKW